MRPSKFHKCEDFQTGQMLLVDKPIGWTSFDVVNKVRFAIKHKLKVRKIKVGHSGTLDPMATGLLIICTGKWTKALHELQGLDKVYTGEITVGATTATYDGEAVPENQKPYTHLTQEMILSQTDEFQGPLNQIPPIFSAIKKDGVAAYQLARRGKEIELEPRPVVIHSFQIDRIDLPKISFIVRCSKGFYVRSLAHDFGSALGTGGYLSALRRTAIGAYRVEDAWNLEDLIQSIDALDAPVEAS
jgi:tRNA pseudouridine55 synthase